MKFFGDEDKLKSDEVLLRSFDLGAHVFAGIGFGRFGFNVGFQPGFISIDPSVGSLPTDDMDTEKINHSSIYFGLTYMLMNPDNSGRR